MPQNYYQIIRQIDKNIDLSSLSAEERLHYEKSLRDHLNTLNENENPEEIALAKIYSLVLKIKTKQIKNQNQIKEEYKNILKYFQKEEKNYQNLLKESDTSQARKLHVHQLVSFYKLLEFYLTNLENTLNFHGYKEMVNIIKIKKIHIFQKQQIYERNIRKLLAYTRFSLNMFLKRHLFLYSFLAFVGIVLVWHGLWGLYDTIIALFEIENAYIPYISTTIIGTSLLYILGIYFQQSIGDEETLNTIEKMQKENLDEMKTIEKIIKKKT